MPDSDWLLLCIKQVTPLDTRSLQFSLAAMAIRLGALSRTWVNAVLGFIYPEVCHLCGSRRASPEQGYVCASCRSEVQYVEPPFCARCGLPHQGAITVSYVCGNCGELELYFESARSATLARGPVLEAIHAYKYRRAVWLEPFLGELITRNAGFDLSAADWDAIVPIPLHPLKVREREFNQSERLARALSRATGIPVAARVLERVVPTRTQTRLSRSERQENVKNAFQLREDATVSGERVVLVDDVFTTGSTTNECARVLVRAGAVRVCVWTLARGI